SPRGCRPPRVRGNWETPCPAVSGRVPSRSGRPPGRGAEPRYRAAPAVAWRCTRGRRGGPGPCHGRGRAALRRRCRRRKDRTPARAGVRLRDSEAGSVQLRLRWWLAGPLSPALGTVAPLPRPIRRQTAGASTVLGTTSHILGVVRRGRLWRPLRRAAGHLHASGSESAGCPSALTVHALILAWKSALWRVPEGHFLLLPRC